MELLNKHKHGTPEGSIYIGRGSPFGNPWVIGKDGTRQEVIAKYRKYLEQKILDNDPEIMIALRNLRDSSRLLCFCVPAPCHGEVIIEYWNEIMAYESFDKGYNEFIKKHSNTKIYYPTTEGIDHINIYTKSRTALGKLLSNLELTPIYHPRYGYFSSVENFWYWYGTGMVHDRLRTMYPREAKKVGMQYDKVVTADFEEEIIYALKLKLTQHSDILKLFLENTLPLTHYYYYGDNLENVKVVQPSSAKWLVDRYNEIKEEFSKPRNKVIIAGSRSITIQDYLEEAIKQFDVKIDEVVSGHARGADTLGEHYAADNRIPVKIFIPNWDIEKKRAGIIRNVQMAEYADCLIALWDGKSPGTKHMIEHMEKIGKKVYVKVIQEELTLS